MQNELVIISEDDTRNKIYYIRDKEVMLDSDLDEEYRFQLTRDEYINILRCKNCTLELEQGIYMLMTIF
jgi:hypothetical protein